MTALLGGRSAVGSGAACVRRGSSVIVCGGRNRLANRLFWCERLAGVSLVEMLVCLMLAMLIALMAIGLLVSSRATFSAQDNAAQLVETGHVALATIERAIRQAGYENWSALGAALVAAPGMAPAILGLDDVLLPAMSAALASANSPGVNGSDVLAIRFFGSGDSSGMGDGSVLNCAGVAVAEPANGDLDHGRGWSIFHIARDSAGRSELRCKYRARDGSNWSSESVAQGIDAMQVLYGVDASGDGVPERFMNATALNEALAQPNSANDAAANSETNNAFNSATGSAVNSALHSASVAPSNPWNDVVAIRIALLVRGPERVAVSPAGKVFDFFGAVYSAGRGSSDRGVRILEKELALDGLDRVRRLFSLTVPLRNRAGRNTTLGKPS